MKNLLKHISLILCCFPLGLIAQTFQANISSPINLMGANGSCASPGTGVNVIEIPVSGIGVFNATHALNLISVRLSNACKAGSVNLDRVAFRIMAPNNTYIGVYSGGLSTSASGSHTINLVSPQPCLRNPNTNNGSGGTQNGSGNYGFFNAQFNGIGSDLTTTFNGVNADGTWKLIFSENTSFEPCLEAASIRFGNPSTANEIGNGNTCNTAILFNGSPLCASTANMSGELNSPGSNTGQGDISISSFANGTCDWNGNNNNDIWIRFIAHTPAVCIGISGLQQNLQSIVVSHPNNCPSSGEHWNIVSCPRNGLYTTTAGTQNNQQHCFTATIGQTYYLVIDGNGGAESGIYINGNIGSDPFLHVEWLYFRGEHSPDGNQLNWATSNEAQNEIFNIETSSNGIDFNTIGHLPSQGNSAEIQTYSFLDPLPQAELQYYRIAQLGTDQTLTYSKIIAITAPITARPLVYPNPTENEAFISCQKRQQPLIVVDALGRIMYQATEIPEKLNVSDWPTGIYYIKTNEWQLKFKKQ